jgi:hypothetical protein
MSVEVADVDPVVVRVQVLAIDDTDASGPHASREVFGAVPRIPERAARQADAG